jgi:hypothetical protein
MRAQSTKKWRGSLPRVNQRLNGVTKSASLVLLLCLCFWMVGATEPVAYGVAYHVSELGSDANPGTFARPFRTIQRAVNAVTPGDTILVHPGTYQGQVIIKRSGSSGKFITLRAAVDGATNTVTVKASFPIRSCDERGPATQRTIMITGGSDFWIIRDLNIVGGIYIIGSLTEAELARHTTNRNLPGRGMYDPAGADKTLPMLGSNPADYIYIQDNDITGMGVFTSQARRGRLENNEIHHIACGTGSAVWISTFSDKWLIRNNYVHHTGPSKYHWQDEGIRIGRSSMYNTIANNRVEDLAGLGRGIAADVHASWNVIRGNFVTRAYHGLADQNGGAWGNQWLYNISASNRKFGFRVSGDVFTMSDSVPMYLKMECNESRNDPLALRIGAAAKSKFAKNKFSRVILGSWVKTNWAKLGNTWEGKSIPPPEFPSTASFSQC